MGRIKEHFVCMSNDESIEAKHEEVSVTHCIIKTACSEGFLLLLGLIAIALDPLFFYVPVMKNRSTCLGLDKSLIIVIVTLRTLVDFLHDWSWWTKSCRNREQYKRKRKGKREWIGCMDIFQNFLLWFRSHRISSPIGRSSTISWAIAITASLPLPQVAALTALALDFQSFLRAWIILAVTFQFLPRYFRIHPTYAAAVQSSDIYAWIGAAFNLLLFVIAGHALGGFWYLRAISRRMDCMVKACQFHRGCTASSLYCESGNHANNGFINDMCTPQPTSNATTPFDYGIYSDAITTNLVGSTYIINNISHGFWWGLNNLSSMAQNLEFGESVWDTCFAIFICILGLFLIALLIGNLQLYLQSSIPSKLERWQEKKEQLQKWVPFLSVPRGLRERVNTCQHHRWLKASEVNIVNLLTNTPWELKKELKKHFHEKLFSQIQNFEELHQEIKKDLRDRARPMVFQAGTVIHECGLYFYEMIHIVQGKVVRYDGSADALHLKNDESFGGELLHRALQSDSPKLPCATSTFQSVSKLKHLFCHWMT